MAAYRRVYDSHHLQADCKEPGSAPEPGNREWASFIFTFRRGGVLLSMGLSVCLGVRPRAYLQNRMSRSAYEALTPVLRRVHGCHCTWWAKKTGPQTHDHNSVIS